MAEIKTVTMPIELPSEYDQCARCLDWFRNAILNLDGVVDVHVNNESSEMTLTYDSYFMQYDDIKKHAKLTGIALQDKFLHKTLKLKGLDCPDCAASLEHKIEKSDGILYASVNYVLSSISVEYESAATDLSKITDRIRKLGYSVVEESEICPKQEEQNSLINRIKKADKETLLTVFSGLMILMAVVLSYLHVNEILIKTLYGLAALFGGYSAFRGAFYSIRTLSLDMNFLIAIAVIGAVSIGEWFDAAMVMFLFSLGNALEAHTMGKTRDSVRLLLKGFPAQARVRRNNAETYIKLEDIRVGDIFIVLPGEKIPADGAITEGITSVDQSSITGESVLVGKTAGDLVFAGTLNVQGAFEAAASSATADNTLSKIIHLVEEAQAEKAPSQRFSEEFSKYYTPVVVILAVIVASIPPLVFHADFVIWLKKALTLLVVSCPCALVISTPVSIVSAIGRAAHQGILIKGGMHLENLAKINVVVFDKTGTVTSGELSVLKVIAFNDFSESDILSIASSVECRSDHPLAKAIINRANELGVEYTAASGIENVPGMGTFGVLNDMRYAVGNLQYMKSLGVEVESHTENIDADGSTVVAAAVGNNLAGLILLSDTLRSTSLEAVNELKQNGIKRIVMLTGDNKNTAGVVAAKLGIDEFQSDLLPQQKMDAVNDLMREQGSKVAFVGDGVNDAPSLASADIGIAMGVAGSDTALETADVALMSNDLRKIPYAIRLGRAAITIIKQNTVFALSVIFFLIISALTGWIDLSLGVLGHEGGALIVIANGMRLLRYK